MSREIFLPMPFSLPDVLADLGLDNGVAARLQGFGLGVPTGQPWLVVPCPAEGAEAQGVLLEPEARDAVSDLATKLGWEFSKQKVRSNDGWEVSCNALLPSDLCDADLAAADQWSAPFFRAVWAELRTRPAADQRAALGQMQARATARLAAQQGTPATVRSDMRADAVREVSHRITHDGFFQFHQLDLQHPRFNGTLSSEVSREVFVATDAAIVLPYDPVRDRVLLVEQFRMGPYERGDLLPFCLEPVAGRVDGGEHPETTARRECVEEAGLTLSRLLHVSSHYPSPGASTEYFHFYIGLCDLPDLLQGTGGLEAEHEDIRTHVLGFDDAFALISSGEANVGPLVLCLLWLDRQRSALRGSDTHVR